MSFHRSIIIKMPDLVIKDVKGEWMYTQRSMYIPSIEPYEEDEDFNTCRFEIDDDEMDLAISDRIYCDTVDVYTFINHWQCDNDMHWSISIDNIDEELQKIVKWIEKKWDGLMR